jgi:hypothetical protein
MSELYSQKIAGSRPDEMIFLFSLPNSSSRIGPGVYSASNRNEYVREIDCFLGTERGRCVRLTTSPSSVSRLPRQRGILHYRPPLPVTGIALLLPNCIFFSRWLFTILMRMRNSSWNTKERIRLSWTRCREIVSITAFRKNLVLPSSEWNGNSYDLIFLTGPAA